MTYEQWCKHSTEILKEASEVNEWIDKAKHNLLVNIGPQLEELRKTGYMGCGFHYSLEHLFGCLIQNMCYHWQPCANWCQNVEEDRMKYLTTKVVYESLLKQVEAAKASKFQKP